LKRPRKDEPEAFDIYGDDDDDGSTTGVVGEEAELDL
jgi:hypothetical protein